MSIRYAFTEIKRRKLRSSANILGYIIANLVELNAELKVTVIVASHGAFPQCEAERILYIKDGEIV